MKGSGFLVHLGLGSDLVFRTLEFELLVMTPSFILSFRILVLRLEYDSFPQWGTTPCPFQSTPSSLGISVSPRALRSSLVTGDRPVIGRL